MSENLNDFEEQLQLQYQPLQHSQQLQEQELLKRPAHTEQQSALLPAPWRKGKEKDAWSEETKKTLKDEVKTHKLCKDAEIENINILLVGEISAGKSSFVNSVESVFAGHVTIRANAGSVGESLTTEYRKYRVKARNKGEKAIKFKFCDSMGLEGYDAGLSATDVGKIMDGNVDEFAELSHGIRPGLPGYNANPTDDDRIHCLAFVVNATTVGMLDDGIVCKIKEIRKEANGRKLNPIVILTRIDEICKHTLMETSKVFHSSTVRDKVWAVSKLFGINQSQIYPVRNYNNQTDCETDMDILILRVARQIVRNSEDFLLDKLERREGEDKILKKKLKEMKAREKKKPWKKRNTSDDSEAESGGSSEEDQEDDSNSDNSVEPEVPKKNRSFPGDYQDSDYLPNKSRDKTRGSKQPPAPPKARKVPPPPPSACKKGVILYDFDGERDDGEIPRLREGEEVTEIAPDQGGWTMVRNAAGIKGMAPTSYIDWSSVKGSKQPPRPPKKQKKMLAVYDYNAQDENEVNLDVDEELIELQPDNEGWTMVRKEDGDEGLVPSEFLGQPPSHSKQVRKTPPKPPHHVSEGLPMHPSHSVSRKVPTSSPHLQSNARNNPKPVPPPSNRKPSKKKPASQPSLSPLYESTAATSTQPSSPIQPSTPPPPPPPQPTLPQANMANISNQAASPTEKPMDLLQAIRNAGGIKSLKSDKKDTKKPCKQDPTHPTTNFMGDLKSRLTKRRSAVMPDLSEKIPFTSPAMSSDSDFDSD